MHMTSEIDLNLYIGTYGEVNKTITASNVVFENMNISKKNGK